MDATFREALLTRSRGQIAARPRAARRRRWGLSLTAAAAVVIGAAGIRQALVRPPEGPFVAVVEVRGDVTDAKGAVVALGEKLPVGTGVKTGEGARVTLVTRRGSQFTLDGGTSLSLTSASTAALESGRVYCRSRRGEIEEIETSPGTIRLLGTTLDAAMENGDSVAVTVVDGRVRLSNSQGEAEVSAGRRALLVASLRPDSGQPVNVREATAWYYGRSDIVSDFGDVAYLVTRDDAQGLASEVWMMRQDGSGKRRLKTYLGGCQAPGPWLPGQQWLMVNAHSILWSTPDFDNRRAHTGAGHPILDDQAWLINGVGGQDLAFDLPPGTDPLYTDLSPDGSKLAFCGRYQPDPASREGMEGGVWVLDMTSGQMKKLLNGYIKTPLSWAPDSRRIVADTGEGYGLDHPLVVVAADAAEIRSLGVNGADGVFSPDGQKIAYVGQFQRGGSWAMGVPMSGRIMVYDLASGKTAPISPAGEGALKPRWSPDGQRVSYRVSSGQRAATIFVASADGAGSRKIYDCAEGLASYAWGPDGEGLYLVTANGIKTIAASGSGLLAELGGTPDDSVLTAEQAGQTQAALAAVREAVFQFAVGNVRRFEGKPRDAQAAFQAASDIFAGLAWEYPLAQFGVDQLMLYADKAAEMGAVPASLMLSKSCEERLSYLEILLLQYAGAKDGFPPDLGALEQHSLQSGWGINWISNENTEWVKMMFGCPGGGEYEYAAPPGGAPELGDVLVKCSAHPDHSIIWTEKLAQQLEWRRE